mmetsp:Transcript_22284/g.66037  ORF Transcript_22284/g.66037 Transcript_22284/m.66037 type:complete len:251 (+) Transcript_22284:129-881(+)
MHLIRSLTALSSSLVVCSALAAQPSTGKLQLKYFNARGAAETARILLALSDEEWDDSRFDMTPGKMESPAFEAAKASGELKVNLNRAPILLTPDGTTIGQSKAIERFLARRSGLMGSNDVEEAMIDCVAEHCRDVRDAQMRKGFSMFNKDKTDEEKAKLREEWFESEMPTMLGKIDDAVKESGTPGFSVGSSTSLSDVAIWSMLRDCYAPYAEETAKATEKCKALKAISDQVGSNPLVEKWLKDRPETAF